MDLTGAMNSDVVDAFRWQAQACRDLGSCMYAELLTRIADDLRDDGVLTRRALAGRGNNAGPSALALRLLGAVHRQVLEGRAESLASFYPTVGGRWNLDSAWPLFLRTLDERRGEIAQLLDHAPQTNEVGRSAALLGGLLHIAARTKKPIRLFEIGASGGLNLYADQYRYVGVDEAWGPLDSPVVLEPAWQGADLPDADIEIVVRVGSDIAPVDVTSEDGRLTLLSYVWPDQPARIGRLAGAFEIARREPPDLRACDASTFMRSVELERGTVTVLWHSVVWQYLTDDEKDRLSRRIERLAAHATPDEPFAHLSLEPGRRTGESELEFLVELRLHPGGDREILGTAAPHGLPTIWE